MMDLRALTVAELMQLSQDIEAEKRRRQNLEALPAQFASLNRLYLEAEGVADGDAWRQPTGAHDAYPADWKVTFGDKTWVSLIPANVWKPGASGWREVVDPGPDGEPTYPAWVQPTGAHDAYALDAIVSYSGSLWKSTASANVWAPGVYGWVTYTP